METCDIDHLHKRFLDIWEWCTRQGFDTRAFTYVEHAFKSEPTFEIEDHKENEIICPKCGRSDYIRSFEKDFGIKNSGYEYKCINCNTYIGWKGDSDDDNIR